MEGGLSDEVDWIALSGAKAKGVRPAYLSDPAAERLLSMVLALAAELSATRERLDTVERLLDARGSFTLADIEAYRPDRSASLERGLATRAFIARVLRGLQQEQEALADDTLPVDELIERLREM